MASANRLVLGQEATEARSTGIAAIPKPLELLELRGCLVSIDAMGCPTAITAEVVAQGGHYVLGLKGSHSALHEAVEDFWTVAQAGDLAHLVHTYTERARQRPWTPRSAPLLDQRGPAQAPRS